MYNNDIYILTYFIYCFIWRYSINSIIIVIYWCNSFSSTIYARMFSALDIIFGASLSILRTNPPHISIHSISSIVLSEGGVRRFPRNMISFSFFSAILRREAIASFNVDGVYLLTKVEDWKQQKLFK